MNKFTKFALGALISFGLLFLGYILGVLDSDSACVSGEVRTIEGRAYRCVPAVAKP